MTMDKHDISYGSRPFHYKPPPLSIQATRWIGILILGLAAWLAFGAIYAAVAFGLMQFLYLACAAVVLGFVGTLTCAFGWACKAEFDNLQINAFRGK